MADVCDDDGVSGESLKKKEFARTPSCFLQGKISAIRSAPADNHRSMIVTISSMESLEENRLKSIGLEGRVLEKKPFPFSEFSNF